MPFFVFASLSKGVWFYMKNSLPFSVALFEEDFMARKTKKS